jgi:NADPH:quinone reductase-like Zn-dependent oxidoreductase
VVLSCTPLMSESMSVPTRGSSSRPTRSSGSPGPACSDLWPYRGIEAVEGPSPMGHEYAGIIEEVGSAVTTVKPGQFVVGSFFASDNTCDICRAGYHSSCIHREPVGAEGAQAELLRLPLADGTMVATPEVPQTTCCPASWPLPMSSAPAGSAPSPPKPAPVRPWPWSETAR